MSTRFHRRRFLKDISVATLGGSAGLYGLEASRAQRHAAGAETGAYTAKRVFMAGFAHETNTFHPLPTTSFSIREPGPGSVPTLAAWKDTELTVVPGTSAYPTGGGTIDGRACRKAIDRIVQSLRAVMPIDAVFLRLHGAMFAEGVGPAETVLVEQVRAAVGRQVPIACTFDLHGNIPRVLGLPAISSSD